MTTRTVSERYTAIAIVLHWAIAAAILFMVPLGLWIHAQAKAGHVDDNVFHAFQLHKSIGLTVLALSLARLGWRLANPIPPLPAHMPAWEHLAARATHWVFYALTIGLPLTGWLYVSAGWSAETDHPLVVETHYFGLFTVPFLFGLTHASDAVRASTAHTAIVTHWALGWTILGLAALHVGAALKHQFIGRDEVLGRMVPGVHAAHAARAPMNPLRNAVLGGGLTVVVAALIAASYALFSPASAPALTQPSSTFTTTTSRAVDATPNATVPPLAASPTTAGAAAPSAHAGARAPVAHAVAWTVDAAASAVAFTITYANQPYEGAFDRWRADIRFSPDDLAHSSAQVTLETASAHTSDQMQTSQIGSEPWFDTAHFATATFRTNVIRRLTGDSYEAQGALTLKGHTHDVTLPFTLTIAGKRATMSGHITLNRQDFGVGAGDNSIGADVAVRVRVVATRAS